MPRNREESHVRSSPHQDGKREGVINDTQGVQIGIQTDRKLINHANSIHNRTKDEALKNFEQLTQGDLANDKDNP